MLNYFSISGSKKLIAEPKRAESSGLTVVHVRVMIKSVWCPMFIKLGIHGAHPKKATPTI
jgi:hypothetical protein